MSVMSGAIVPKRAGWLSRAKTPAPKSVAPKFVAPKPVALEPAPAARAPLWLAGACAIVGFMAVIALRAPIVRLAPQTASVYSAMGFKVNLVGLDLTKASARSVPDGARRILVVEGEIANPSSAERTIPPVRVALRGADNATLYQWAVKPPKETLSAGEKVSFAARLAAPPDEAGEAFVTFDEPGAAKAQAKPKAAPKRSLAQGSSSLSQ